MSLDKRNIILVALISVAVFFSAEGWQFMYGSTAKENVAVSSSIWNGRLQREENSNFQSGIEKTLDSMLNTMKTIQTQVTGLTRQVGNVRKDIDVLTLQSSQVDFQRPDASLDVLAMTEEELSERAEQQRIEQEIIFEENFLSEAVDPAWSQAAEEKTVEALSTVSDRLNILDIECKRSTCRLQIARAEGITDNGSVFDAFETGLNWDGEMYMTYDPESGEGMAYLAREGYALSDSVEIEG